MGTRSIALCAVVLGLAFAGGCSKPKVPADTAAVVADTIYAGGDIVTGAATVIQAMGAGRKAARGMKAWLGLRDTEDVYLPDSDDAADKLFGIHRRERNFARVHLA